MSHDFRFTREKIAARLKLIAPLVHRRRAPLPNFRYLALPDAGTDPPLDADPCGWPEIAPDSYWGQWDQNFLLRTHFTVPGDWDASSTALYFPMGNSGDIFTHPEALIHVDGRALASADRYHHTIPLPPRHGDGARHDLALHGWTGWSDWPPDRAAKTRLFMRECALVETDPALAALITLAETALDIALHQDRGRPEPHRILNALDRAFLILDTRDPLGGAFRRSIAPALAALRDGLSQAGAPMDVRLHAIGHAHMDIAYLWPVAQIRRKNARTYANVLRLMERCPDYRFSHSQAQLYRFTERDYPEIFEAIRARVAEGRWEVMGGMWVEADANMPGAEALVRQILLGRRYFRDTFGDVETPVLWLPDTFGFPWCLPQLMAEAGLTWFVTNKPNWNQHSRQPESTFWWQGLDGTRVLAHILTTPRDVQHLPFPTSYKSDLTAREVFGTWETCTQKERMRDLPIAFGYGDGGGGPTEALIRKAEALAAMPGAPQVRMGTVRGFFETLEADAADLPVWADEIYVEGHRGVLTGQAAIKRQNRRAEAALHEAEFLATLAHITTGADYPQTKLTRAWELLCLNQFHDILTGTAIPEVFDDADRDFAEIDAISERATSDALAALSAPMSTDMAWLATNSAPFAGPRLIEIPGSPGPLAMDGEPLAMQATATGTLYALTDLPAYSVTSLQSASEPGTASRRVHVVQNAAGVVLVNDFLKVLFDAQGRLTTIHDREVRRDVLGPGAIANVLEAFEDRPVSWDAWDIDPFFEDRAEIVGGLEEITLTEAGPLRATVEIRRRWRSSTLRQSVRLTALSRRIDFVTEIDWHETHTLLKVSFPVDILAPMATYDIQWGSIERPTHRNTHRDRSRFEVAAQKWADLSEADYGVAILNDCKYGHDIRGNVLRLSLIKSATMPNATADQGRHVFTYSLLPHPGGWGDTVPAEAYALNLPVRVTAATGGGTATRHRFIREISPNAIIETIKRAEDGTGYVLRLYESRRQRGQVRIVFGPRISGLWRSNLMEDRLEEIAVEENTCSIALKPFQIVTLRFDC